MALWFGCGRGRRLAPCAALALALLAPGEAAAQRWTWSARGGVVWSTPLVEDHVAPVPAEPVVLRLAPAPALAFDIAAGLRPGVAIVASAGWARSSQRVGGAEARRLGSVDVAHATVGLRTRVADRLHVRAGAGAVHYLAGRSGIFRDGSGPAALLDVAVEAAWRAGPGNVVLELAGQAHRFGTRALRAEGGVDGTVYRVAATGGFRFGSAGAP